MSVPAILRPDPAPRPTRRAAYPVTTWRPVLLVSTLTVLVRLPFLTLAPTPDEGGLLMVAGQWGPGRSLYGGYWVDRPPLLIAFVAVADRLGGVVALRVLGLGLVVAAVLLAGLVGRLAGGRAVPAAIVAAVLLCQPRFGAFEVDGELIAVPLVMAGFAGVLAAARCTEPRAVVLRLIGAGACGSAAALVKQNEIDVIVLLLVAAVTVLRRAPVSRHRMALAALAGAAAVIAPTLAMAVDRGTRLTALIDAVVTFRLHASSVIAAQASAATSDRLHHLLLAAVLAGVPLLIGRWLLDLRRPPASGALDLRWPTAALLAWESFSVLGGGSYWHHYLICLVPGLVLAEASVRERVAWPLVALTVACLLPLAPAYADQVTHPRPEHAAVTVWLRGHVRPGDSGVVAYGHADLLQTAGLRSPYPELWSLPVRVRDPRLVHLTRVLWSPRRPDWILTGPTGDLSGWGIDDAAAEIPFHLHYREVAAFPGIRVFQSR